MKRGRERDTRKRVHERVIVQKREGERERQSERKEKKMKDSEREGEIETAVIFWYFGIIELTNSPTQL